jgi:hypothetical protein
VALASRLGGSHSRIRWLYAAGILTNQNGDNSPNRNTRFEYLSGSIENDTSIDKKSEYILENRSIQQHICDVLEGGKEAFDLRKKKYRI